jgi:predicted Zn-dependent protease
VTPQDLVERALAASRADGCVVIARESSSVNLRFAGNTLTTNGAMRSRSVTVVAVVDGVAGTASGVVTRSHVAAAEVAALVEAAERAARESEPAEDAAPLVAGGAASPTWADEPAVTTTGVFAGLAPALGAAFARARAEQRELFGFAEHDVVTSYVGSSTGLRLRHDQPTGRLEVTGKSHGRTRSTWVGRSTRDFTDVDVPALDDEVVRRLGWAARTVELSPGRYETILPPSAVADLMVYLYWSAAARDAHDGRTVFSRPGGGTRVGERLSDRLLSLWSDPGHPGLECEPFVLAASSGPASSVFDNGLPLARTAWVDEGRLAALLQTRHSAAVTGLPLTPAIDNLGLDVAGGAGGVDDLVAATSGRALLLTCLWYIREVDPQTLLLTGLTRDGVHVVEDGEVVGTTTNFRFNESPVDLLGRVAAAGGTELTLPREWSDFFTRTAMPALRVDGFNMSTVSPAS